MKILQIFNQVKESFKGLWSWVRIRPKNAIIAASILLAVVLGLILFIKFVLPILLIVALMVYVFFGDKVVDVFTTKTMPPPLTLENDVVCWEAMQFLHEVFLYAHEVLSEYVIVPRTVSDMYDPAAFRKAYNHVPMLTLRLLRKRKEISCEDSYFIKEALQSMSDSRLHDGYLSGYLWAAPAAYDTPLLKIVSVGFSDMYLHIGILLTNTPMSVQAAHLSDRHTPPSFGDDTDPLFCEGGD